MQINTPEHPLQAITVRYIYSACIVTTTPDLRVIHDPWFSEGIYDGSWFHFPKVERPLENLGDCDLIYVSHLHPDHYDSAFLRQYFERYGSKPIIIADHAPNHLQNKMRADGFSAKVLSDSLQIGSTRVSILPHKSGGMSDIDSAIIIEYFDSDGKRHCVVNANDIVFDDAMRDRLKQVAGQVDILLCGYTGAGPYPQTYFELDDPLLVLEAKRKKEAFFRRYQTLTQAIDASVNIPFAGKYLLGGRCSKLNAHRGIADAVEILQLDSRACVLSDNGGQIDTKALRPTSVRTEAYPPAAIDARIAEIASAQMDYERLIAANEIAQLPIKRLLKVAARQAQSKSVCDEDYYFCFSLGSAQYAVVNANNATDGTVVFVDHKETLPVPRSEIYMDLRYLFGLLTHVYHWNNAEVGSQYYTRRYPNQLNRKAQAFLNHFAV